MIYDEDDMYMLADHGCVFEPCLCSTNCNMEFCFGCGDGREIDE